MTRLVAVDLTTGADFSANPLDDLRTLLEFEFMRNALVAGTAVALVAGLVGYLVVLRGLAFAGHALSQVGFVGASGAIVIGIPPIAGLLAVNAVGAVCIGLAGRDLRSRDVATGVVLSTVLGIGLLILAFGTPQAAVPVLVGDIYAVSGGAVTVSLVAAVAVVVVLLAAGRPLLFSALDPEVAAARGVPAAALGLALLVLLGAVSAVATPLVGVLLGFSLLIAPAAAVAQLAGSPGRALAASAALAVADLWVGLAVAYWVDIPPGVLVTALAVAGYAVARVIRRTRGVPT